MEANNKIPLNEYITLQRGFDLPKTDRSEGDVPVVASTGISSTHNEAKVNAPGVVIGRSGSIGGGQYITKDFWPLNTTLWVKDFKEHEPRYIYYLLKSINFQSFNVGSGVPTLNRNHLRSVLVNDIGLRTEKRIAHILGSLDDKIELNRQMNETLESMAQALFKSWFVDFDPVIDNALAAGNSIPEPLQKRADTRKALRDAGEAKDLPEDVRSLFPDRFVLTDEMGWVPEGWEVGQLRDFIKFSNGKSIKPTEVGDFEIYGANGIIGKSNEFKFHEAAIIGRVGAYCGSVKYCLDKFWASDNTIVATPSKGETGLPIVFYQLSTLDLNKHAGGAAQPLLNQSILNSFPVFKTNTAAHSYFNKVVGIKLATISDHLNEINTLSKLRDTLLPKLISGELRIPEAEKQIEEAIA